MSRGRIANDRRSETIDAFIACVRRVGLQGATVDQVAKAASVSRALVFHWVADMQSLVQEAVDQISANAVCDLAKNVDGLSGRNRQSAGRRSASPRGRRPAG